MQIIIIFLIVPESTAGPVVNNNIGSIDMNNTPDPKNKNKNKNQKKKKNTIPETFL